MAQDMIITCDGCGKQAKLDASGDWIHLEARKIEMDEYDRERSFDICLRCKTALKEQFNLKLW
jgi:hypothetical protein